MSKYNIIEEEETSEKDNSTEKTEKSPKEKVKKEKKAKNGGVVKNKAKETISELKKVTWPTFGETMKKTGVVLAFVAIALVALLIIDLILGNLINLL